MHHVLGQQNRVEQCAACCLCGPHRVGDAYDTGRHSHCYGAVLAWSLLSPDGQPAVALECFCMQCCTISVCCWGLFGLCFCSSLHGILGVGPDQCVTVVCRVVKMVVSCTTAVVLLPNMNQLQQCARQQGRTTANVARPCSLLGEPQQCCLACACLRL
jgi:hypothetical protein